MKRKKMNELKFDVYGGIIFWPLLGITVLIGNYLFFNYLSSKGIFSTISLIFFVIGIFLIAMGTGPFIEFKKQKKLIEEQVKIITETLSLYNKKYVVNYYPKRNFLDTRIMVKNVEILEI
ncbi:hypothetical protein [Tenacibaculum sp. 190524A05c]|uniref:hypothetical protein n=1 Tax=Tenacibaculum platacis TaxID=3137852 RepID=UPI0032B0F90F